jgi:exonuclease VII small subunit
MASPSSVIREILAATLETVVHCLNRIDTRLDKLEQQVNNLEQKVDRWEQHVGKLDVELTAYQKG